MQIVPVSSLNNQTLNITLSVDGNNLPLQLGFIYNEQGPYWQMSVSDQAGNSLIASVPLIGGVYPAANLLGQYAYLKIGSAYLVNAGNVAMDAPDNTNLGSDFILAWGDTP